MSRVLVTGGAGAIGAAIARRLLADPRYDVRIADRRPAPLWMREGCEIRDGDLRAPAQALAASKGCSLVVHLATHVLGVEASEPTPYALIEHENAMHAAVVGAAVEHGVERLLYVSSAAVLDGARRLPAPESDVDECPAPRSARAFARLSGERYCRAAREQHALAVTICRPSAVYGKTIASDAGDGTQAGPDAGEPGVEPLIGQLVAAAIAGERSFELTGSPERTLAPTHVEDVAEGVVLALGSDAALDEDFNLAGECELTVAEIARVAREAAGASARVLALKPSAPADAGDTADAPRSWPSTQKARELLGWQAQVEIGDGLAATARALRQADARRIGAAI
jgi:nucleoside-diphosphate-sugar epimerase